MRIPCVCTDGLQNRSGQDGIYIEPRRADGRGPAYDFNVIWLPNVEKQDALHRLKVSDRGVALARFGGRYGIRVLCRDAESFHKEMFPDKPYQQVNIQSIYELRPLPYGIQTAGVRELLKQWGWKAKVLQPYKADQHGQGWLVGTETPPPASVFQTSNGDVLVTMHKKQGMDRSEPVILASTKTKTFLKKAPLREQHAGSAEKENIMPWNGVDPWGGYNKFKENADQDVQMARSSKAERWQTQVHEVVENSLKDATEQRFQKLETGLTELREQNQKFENWFGEAGQSTAALRQDVNQLSGQVRENQQNITSLSGEIRSGFANLEALLAKKQRQE
jgi:FtsZ-binding cell division protein ZapB